MLTLTLILAMTLCFISIKRYGKIFNPYTLEVYITILFLIVPQLLLTLVDPEASTYLYSDLAIITYLVAVFIGTLINVKAMPLKALQNANGVNMVNIGLYLMLFVPLILNFQIGLSFSSIRNFYETVVFSSYASLFELSKYLLYFIIIIRLFRTHKFDIIILFLSSLLLLYGSKYALFDLIVILFIYYEQFRRLSIKRFIFFGLITGFLLVSYRYYQSSGERSVLVTSLDYFDLYRNQSKLIKAILEGDRDYYYGRVYFSSYLKYIPRAFWEDKPRAFGFAILNYDFYPESAMHGYMPAFGLGSTFADFGYFSIFFFGFCSGFLKNYFYRAFLVSKNNITFILFTFPLNFITIFFVSIQVLVDFSIRLFSGKINSTTAVDKN